MKSEKNQRELKPEEYGYVKNLGKIKKEMAKG